MYHMLSNKGERLSLWSRMRATHWYKLSTTFSHGRRATCWCAHLPAPQGTCIRTLPAFEMQQDGQSVHRWSSVSCWGAAELVCRHFSSSPPHNTHTAIFTLPTTARVPLPTAPLTKGTASTHRYGFQREAREASVMSKRVFSSCRPERS